MDTMLILHIALLSTVAIVSSHSYNKTTRTPITYTISKVIDLTKGSNNESSTPELNRRSNSLKNPSGIIKRQDPSFSSSLSSFDEPSGATFSDSLSGFTGSKHSTKDSFDIDDIDVKSNPSFDIEDSRIKTSPTFSLGGSKINEASSFDIDTPSFSLDGGAFKIDDAAFNLESPAFDDEESQDKEDPSFSIDPSDFDINESSTHKTSNFESDFHNEKRSPHYSSGNGKGYSDSSDDYRPQSSNSRSKSYDSSSKENYKYPKSQGQSYSQPQDSYSNPAHSSTSTGPVYSDTKVQYVGSSATPISYVTTPYDKFDTPLAAEGSKILPSTGHNFNGFGQSSFQNSPFGQYPFQNLNGNSFLQNRFSNPPVTQTPIYSTQYPGPKNSQQNFSPTHQTAINLSPSTQSFETLPQNVPFANSQLDYNKPVAQIQNKDFSGFIQALESEPIMLNTGSSFNFQAPNFGIPFDFGKETRNQPFLATAGQQQRQVLPVQSSSSTPQFPQYKGASIQVNSRNDFTKSPGGYQFLTNQPQLHFNPQNAPIDRTHIYAEPNPYARIRTDVEVINKKKPAPPQNDDRDDEEDTDEEEDDDAYKSIEQEYSRSDEDESSKAQVNSEEGSSENYSIEEPEFKSLPPMSPFVFQPYDDKIGRLHEFVNDHQPQSRFSVESSAEDDEDYSPKKYASINSASSEYDESNDNEESKNFEKQEGNRDYRVSSGQGLQALRNYDLQFEKKFSAPYKTAAVLNNFAKDRTNLPDISKYKKKKNSQESAESTRRSFKAGIDSPLKGISKNNEDETKFDFQRGVYDKSFGHKIPTKLGEKQKLSSNRKITDSLSRFKKDNSRQENSSKKGDKQSETIDSLVRPSQTVKNVAFSTEDDYNYFSPQRIKSGSSF